MTPAQLVAAERNAFRQFVDAVLALSYDPGPSNVERYLAASQSLDESQQRLDPRRRHTQRKEYAR
jgi:hypothetical protein